MPGNASTAGLRVWLQAARPLAHPNIASPLILGQALAYHQTGQARWLIAGWLLVFGLFDHLFIVFANDYADRAHDGERTLFSGGSGVLVEGKLTPAVLKRAAMRMAAGVFLVGCGLSVFGTWQIAVLSAVALLLLWMYSFPPVQRSYRGGGEWLQGLGLGAVLPMIGFAAQAGSLSTFPWLLLVGTVPLWAASNIATALPDIAADRKANKRTLPMLVGATRGAWACVALTVGALLILSAVAFLLFSSIWPLVGFVPIAAGAGLLTALPDNDVRILRFILLQGAAVQTVTLGWAVVLLLG